MNLFFKKHLWTILFAVLLICYTSYVALDTFALPRVYATAQTDNTDTPGTSASSLPQGAISQEEAPAATPNAAVENGPAPQPAAGPAVNENSYTDANISINVSEYREYDTAIYVADIQVSSPEYLKTALAQNVFGKNVTEKTSDMAEDNGAILAINGDYYGTQTKGYVLKNGVLYRDTSESGQEDLVVFDDGRFEIINESEVSAPQLLERGAVQILSFGPALLENGSISVSANDEVGKAKASNPRTAIGIIDDLHYVFVVSDGRTNASSGLSLLQLAEFVQDLGVETAYNLDGGGSSTMVFNGGIVNNPTTNGNKISERSVSDIVYIGY